MKMLFSKKKLKRDTKRDQVLIFYDMLICISSLVIFLARSPLCNWEHFLALKPKLELNSTGRVLLKNEWREGWLFELLPPPSSLLIHLLSFGEKSWNVLTDNRNENWMKTSFPTTREFQSYFLSFDWQSSHHKCTTVFRITFCSVSFHSKLVSCTTLLLLLFDQGKQFFSLSCEWKSIHTTGTEWIIPCFIGRQRQSLSIVEGWTCDDPVQTRFEG